MAKNGIHRTIIYINGKEVAVRVSANSGLSYFFLLLGDRARYPLKLRPEGLVNASIVVAVLRKRGNAFDQHECVFPVYKP